MDPNGGTLSVEVCHFGLRNNDSVDGGTELRKNTALPHSRHRGRAVWDFYELESRSVGSGMSQIRTKPGSTPTGRGAAGWA